jgi:hypothetical protein
MKMPGRKRRAIGWPIMVFLMSIFVIGLVWAALYYGVMQPLQNKITMMFGSNIFNQDSFTFMTTVAAFWTVILTLVFLLWIWQKSTKRDLQGGF